MPGSLLLAALLVLLLLLAYQLWLSYRGSVSAAEMTTRNYAEILEARLQATLRRTDTELQLLVAEMPQKALSKDAASRFEQRMNAHLDSRLFNLQEMAGYRVHDAQGDTLYTSDRANVANVNIADRAYFKLLRDDTRAGLVFSEVLTNRSTGRPMLVIARGLRDERGKFMGVVHGLLELEYYRKQFMLLDLGVNGVVALRRSDNHAQVVRWPDDPDGVNKPLPSDHQIVKWMRTGERVVTLTHGAHTDSIPRIISVKVMQDYPFYFAVGLGRGDVLAGWYMQAMVVAVTTLLLIALLGTLLYRLGRMRVREVGMQTDLERSEAQFRDLAQMVPVGICHFSRDWKYTYVNERYLALTGRSRQELMGRGWPTFVPANDCMKIRRLWEKWDRKGNIFLSEYRFVRPDGQLTYVIGEIQTVTDAGGQLLGYIAALTDITQRKQAEAELLVAKQAAETANISKTRFLAAASHDLRQPIQAINLFRDALGRTELSEEQRTIAKYISLSVHSLGELLYSLLDVSKLDAGQVSPQMKSVQVEDLLKAVDVQFSPLALEKKLRFKLCYPLTGLVLFTDPVLLLSALRNLIDNAFKYTERGGVLVGVRKRGNYAVIQVWDTGIGIEAHHVEQVFDECFQIGNQLRDRAKGLGLGLSIARRMARLLKGELSFRSRFGRGTVFELTVPLAEAGVAIEAAAEPLVPGLGREELLRFRGWRVVVVEDDLLVAKSIEMSLQTLGVRVRIFPDAEAALSSEEVAGADFYISDFRLPGLNGLELLDTLQARSAWPINAVLVTGETSPERIELTSSSPWNVLFKPVDLSALLAVMARVDRH